MAWGINDIDLVAVMINRGLLCCDRDTALMLLITRVHNERLAHLSLVLTESIALLQKSVNKRRLPVVDVRDNCYISNLTFVVHNALLYF